MGTTLHGMNGKGFDLNVYAKESLDWLCWGLKKKYGVYAPMTKADCKIVARILRNKAKLFENVAGDPKHLLQEAMHVYYWINGEKDYFNDPETIKWMRDLAEFFDTCGGLADENGYNEG